MKTRRRLRMQKSDSGTRNVPYSVVSFKNGVGTRLEEPRRNDRSLANRTDIKGRYFARFVNTLRTQQHYSPVSTAANVSRSRRLGRFTIAKNLNETQATSFYWKYIDSRRVRSTLGIIARRGCTTLHVAALKLYLSKTRPEESAETPDVPTTVLFARIRGARVQTDGPVGK